jgi:RecB family exonuclease
MRFITVGGLSIETAVDRIDRLADGRKLVIDYKTGDPSTIKASAWFGDRPDEPQLPLYATHAQGDVAAVVFARVRRGQCSWEGRARDGDIIPPIKSFKESPEACEHSDWPALLEEWRSILENLALAFRSGDARVDPKHNPSTCNYCDIGPLCRIQELSLKQMEEEEKD